MLQFIALRESMCPFLSVTWPGLLKIGFSAGYKCTLLPCLTKINVFGTGE